MRRPREPSLLYPKKTKNPNPSPIGNRFGFFLFGGRGWIRTTEAESSRFTVCPHWPLGNTPIFTFCVLRRTTCLFYHEGRLLSTVFYVFLQMHFPCRETAEQRRGKALQPCGHGKVGEKANRKKLIGKLQEKLGTICEKCKTFCLCIEKRRKA